MFAAEDYLEILNIFLPYFNCKRVNRKTNCFGVQKSTGRWHRAGRYRTEASAFGVIQNQLRAEKLIRKELQLEGFSRQICLIQTTNSQTRIDIVYVPKRTKGADSRPKPNDFGNFNTLCFVEAKKCSNKQIVQRRCHSNLWQSIITHGTRNVSEVL